VEQAAFMQQFEGENNDDIPNDDDEEFNLKLEVLGDKDILVQHLDTYKEFMENKIQACEKNIRLEINKEWTSIETRITDNQHKRNRAIVKEIIETSQEFRENLKEQFDRMKEEYENE